MLLHTPVYLLFLAGVFVVYWLIPVPRLRVRALLLASYGFYATFDLRFPLILAALTVLTYWCGRAIASGQRSRLYATLAVLINLGALVAPLLVTVLRGLSWRTVFVASSAYCAAMLIPAVFLYEEPPRPASKGRLKDVLGGAAEVLRDARFMLMIVIYSGFWILYFQNFSTVLYYLRDVVDKEPVSSAVTSFLAQLGAGGSA